MRKYSDSHLWFERDEAGVVTVGLTAFALKELGEVCFIELPELGKKVCVGQVLFVLESNKASGDFATAVDGEVVAVNDALLRNVDLVNDEPEGAGWLCKLGTVPVGQFDGLMDADSQVG